MKSTYIPFIQCGRMNNSPWRHPGSNSWNLWVSPCMGQKENLQMWLYWNPEMGDYPGLSRWALNVSLMRGWQQWNWQQKGSRWCNNSGWSERKPEAGAPGQGRHQPLEADKTRAQILPSRPPEDPPLWPLDFRSLKLISDFWPLEPLREYTCGVSEHSVRGRSWQLVRVAMEN